MRQALRDKIREGFQAGKEPGGFLGRPVVKNLPSKAWGCRCNPWWGN